MSPERPRVGATTVSFAGAALATSVSGRWPNWLSRPARAIAAGTIRSTRRIQGDSHHVWRSRLVSRVSPSGALATRLHFARGLTVPAFGLFAQVVPGGTLTSSVSFPRTTVHETWIVPNGVGTSPAAAPRSPVCGVTVNVLNPGDVGATPSTYSVRSGAPPLDQPASHDGCVSVGTPPYGPIVSHIVPGPFIAVEPHVR